MPVDFEINLTWPDYDEKILIEEKVMFVVQINGKKRALIKSSKDTKEEELIKLMMLESNITKYLKDKEIKRKIFVPGKLINIIV